MNTKISFFEQPSVTVDVLIFTIVQDELQVLLIQRAEEPYKGVWSIPGGFILRGESLEEAAKRVTVEKTGVDDLYLEQLYTFGQPERDPRARVVSVAYFALIPWQKLKQPASERVSDLRWFPLRKMPRLAFDHQYILEIGLSRLRAKASYSNVVLGFMPERFRLSELQRIYEIILDKPLDKRNFRKRMLALGLLAKTGEQEILGAHRPAMLYHFTSRELQFLP